MRAIQIQEFGGPEVLELADVPTPSPVDGQVLIEVTAAGVNYADTHHAENTYLAPAELPLIPGAEVAGLTPDGQRVVAFVQGGGYAEQAVAWEPHVFPVPEGLDEGAALALLLQGLTAWHLLRTCAHLVSGESVVVHAAAGGVGSLAVQLAKEFGAGRVIGTASSKPKRDFAQSLGADATVDPAADDLKEAIQDANDGRKVDVVLEMAGGPVFDASLAALAPFGRLVTYGMASRTPPSPLHAGALMGRSRAVIGFWLAHCFNRPEMLGPPLAELFDLASSGKLQAVIGGVYPLADARVAHEDIRSRKTRGKLLLDPRA